MDIAKAMALGGEIVHANKCNFSSYDDLKLRCSVCGEPVRLKKGGTRKPHFAHFPGTDPKQVEECELRASIYSKNAQINSFIENRGQRLEIFQQHFLSMIYVGQEKIVDDVKFNNWIYSIKRDNNQAINNIANDCIEYFLTHQKKMEVYCVYLKDDQPLLQQQIALEAIDYLCVKSSYRLLKYIIYYCIYQLDKQNLTKNNIDSICHRAIKIIMLNPWIKALDNKNIKSSIINLSQLFEPEIVKIKSPSPLQIFLVAIQDGTKGKSTKNINSLTINASQLSSVERDKLKSPLDLNHIFSAIQYGSRGGVKKVIISCKVVTEINTDENTAIQFSFMVNEFIKVDSRIKNASGNYVKAEIEIWHPAIVYSFGYDLTLTVETYSNLLFPKGGYLEEYTNITRRDELASLFRSLLSDGKVKLLKTYEDSKGKVRINYAYDCSVLLLYELLEYCHIRLGFKHEPIEFNTVMQCMINAADKATNSGIPLIDGMLLHSLFTAAKEQLKASKNETLLIDKREIDNTFQINRKKILAKAKRSSYDDKNRPCNVRKNMFNTNW
ncbi:hypothetical protein [Nostoc sp. UHCC 0252]|uniref:competence protein CoiA family protein n=1 Tax=Nostoc sp. UHCC 0252 TaxID=3110241 RepID=UPI002B218EAC|nr:hypothetical protein [Nostoc sp. UHCC 0252]MEA5605070.1 hypothetical protein [Nostoc sp. UHCC 0252]